jgi:hypothetical protein
MSAWTSTSCRQRREPALRILLTVAAAQADSADHLLVNDDRKAADERREAALEAPLDAERLVAGERRAVRRQREQVRGALVASGRERLVDGDLRPRDPCPVHAFEHQRIAALVDDAHAFGDANLERLLDRGAHHRACFAEFQSQNAFHGFRGLGEKGATAQQPRYTVLSWV